jgi:hypothetical protein
VSGRVAYLGIADELDAIHDILVDLIDADLRRETIVGRDQSVVVLFHAFLHVAWYFLSGSLQETSETMEIQKNCDMLRIPWQNDGEFDLEITHFLVDDVLGAHLGGGGGGVCWYMCGLWCCGGCEITRNKQYCGSEGCQAR